MRNSVCSARNKGVTFLYIRTSAEDSSVLLLRLVAVSDADDDVDVVDAEEVDAAEVDVDEVKDAAKASTHSSTNTNRGSGSSLVLFAVCTSAVPPSGGGTTRSICTASALCGGGGEADRARKASSSRVGVEAGGASGVSRLDYNIIYIVNSV
jgi:hypothetical protein